MELFEPSVLVLISWSLYVSEAEWFVNGTFQKEMTWDSESGVRPLPEEQKQLAGCSGMSPWSEDWRREDYSGECNLNSSASIWIILFQLMVFKEFCTLSWISYLLSLPLALCSLSNARHPIVSFLMKGTWNKVSTIFSFPRMLLDWLSTTGIL